MSPSRPSARGTSLIEAMAAMVVFVIGILGVMQMNVVASQQNNMARSHTIASKLARDLADSFERLPYTHPIFAPSTLALNDPQFSNFDNTTGLVTLTDALAEDTARPLVGAADAIMMAEGGGTFYQVAWRSQQVPSPTTPGLMDSTHILIMVRYPLPGGLFRQINFWTIKYNPAATTLDPSATLEI